MILPDLQHTCTIPNTTRKIQLGMQTSSLPESKYPQCQLIETYLQKQTFVLDEVAPLLCDNTPCS